MAKELRLRKMEKSDIDRCADILCAVYNNEMWQCRWEKETAVMYLFDFFDFARFVGFIAELDGEVVGGMFCREKIWWNNSELFVEEMFVSPEYQGKGYGSMLMKAAEEYVTKHSLAGITLATNRYTPAPKFYEKNGFSMNEYISFMYKEI